MRLARYSVAFGTLACLGLPFNPPSAGCLGNPLFYIFAGFAGLGLLCGTLGLVGSRRGLAAAGMALSVASPFGAILVARPYSGAKSEHSTVGDMWTVLSAQAAYKDANGGYYGTLECLARPAACVPGYPASGPVFLDSVLASGQVKSGYDRRFVAGPPAPNGRRFSMTSYAYVAVPANPRMIARGFCGDSTGVVCFTQSGQVPPVANGLCVVAGINGTSPCNVLR